MDERDTGGRTGANGAAARLTVDGVTLSRRVRGDGAEGAARVVLRGVSFEVEGGEVFGVIGPSGSGKTSLLRVLNGLETPDEGDVALDGRSITEVDPTEWRRRVSTVFQAPALFPGKVSANVAYPLLLDGVPAGGREARVSECLDLVGLPDEFGGRDAGELSQGERQRVAIARAIARAPEVLLMDEPTSALDPTSGSRILDLVRKLHRELDVAIVFVTHVLEQARAVCDRGLVLVDGAVVEEGPVTRLLDEPSSDITRMFVAGRLDQVSGVAAGTDAGGRATTPGDRTGKAR